MAALPVYEAFDDEEDEEGGGGGAYDEESWIEQAEEEYYEEEEGDEDEFGPGVIISRSIKNEKKKVERIVSDLADQVYSDPLALVNCWEEALFDLKAHHPEKFLPPTEPPRSLSQKQTKAPFWHGPPPTVPNPMPIPSTSKSIPPHLVQPSPSSNPSSRVDGSVNEALYSTNPQPVVPPPVVKKRKRLTGSQKKARKAAKIANGNSSTTTTTTTTNDGEEGSAKVRKVDSSMYLNGNERRGKGKGRADEEEVEEEEEDDDDQPEYRPESPTYSPAVPADVEAHPSLPNGSTSNPNRSDPSHPQTNHSLSSPRPLPTPSNDPQPAYTISSSNPVSRLPKKFPPPPEITPLTGEEPILEPESSESLLESALWSWYTAGYQTALYHASVGVATFKPSSPPPE